MQLNRRFVIFEAGLLTFVLLLTSIGNRLCADTSGNYSGQTITLLFNDVAGNAFFCQIAAAFFSGLTSGTTATTYSPTNTVTREQMAAFISRTLEQSIRRNNRRAVTEKWYLPPDPSGITLTTVGNAPQAVEFDGTDLWVANHNSGTVQRIRPSDGQILQTFTGAHVVNQLVAAQGRIFATGGSTPGQLYGIDPLAGSGTVSILHDNLPAIPIGIAFDGARVWTANQGSISQGPGSVSIITLNPTNATNVFAGFDFPTGILFDGANMWVTDGGLDSLLKLDASGNIVKSIPLGGAGANPERPVFDGINIWVPNNSGSVTVVRVKDSQGNALATPFVLATLTGNGLSGPRAIAFDGERMLVTNFSNRVSLFKAADLSPLGFISTGANTAPTGACSDGLNFWVTFSGTNRLARF
jgi:hypothetical protein